MYADDVSLDQAATCSTGAVFKVGLGVFPGARNFLNDGLQIVLALIVLVMGAVGCAWS